MFSALSKAIGQMGDARIRGVLIGSALGSLVLLVFLSVVAAWALILAGGALTDWAVSGDDGSWLSAILDWLLGAASVAAVLFASFLLFPAAVGLVLSLFLERVVEAVEGRHYPGLPPPRKQPLAEALGGALSFALMAMGINLALLPIYLILLFLPPLNLIVFYMVNGYLLGREYFELVAVRRMKLVEAKQLRRERRGRVLLSGIVIAIMLTIPLLNIAMPAVAAAYMTHVFHGLRQRGA